MRNTDVLSKVAADAKSFELLFGYLFGTAVSSNRDRRHCQAVGIRIAGIIPGAGGLGKARWARRGKGKSGGLRVSRLPGRQSRMRSEAHASHQAIASLAGCTRLRQCDSVAPATRDQSSARRRKACRRPASRAPRSYRKVYHRISPRFTPHPPSPPRPRKVAPRPSRTRRERVAPTDKRARLRLAAR